MKMMKDVPKRDRPREKIAKKGVTSLTEQELIESILGRAQTAKKYRCYTNTTAGNVMTIKAHNGKANLIKT